MIQTYSKCPRQLGYNLLNNVSYPIDSERAVIKDLIKQCYINRSKHGYTPQWETVKARVNKVCFETVDINNQEAFQTAYKRSQSLLKVLHYWYYKHFSDDKRDGLVNIPLAIPVSRSMVTANIDVALLDKKYQIVPIIFNDHDILPSMLYNNIRFKALLWLLYKEAEIEPKLTEYNVIARESIAIHQIYSKSSMDTIGKYVNFIVRGIENKIYYPSVNEQCNTCSFKDICTI